MPHTLGRENSELLIENSTRKDSNQLLLTLLSTALFVICCIHPQQWSYLFVMPNIAETLLFFHYTALKNIVLKRMTLILESVKDSQQQENTFMKLRSILMDNFEINLLYFIQFAGWFLRGMSLCVHTLSAFWAVYGPIPRLIATKQDILYLQYSLCGVPTYSMSF